MANQNQLLSLQPFETNDIEKKGKVPTNTNPHSPPDDILQLQTDVINVLEKRVDINSFSEEYQNKIKNYYKFSATRTLTNEEPNIKFNPQTLDLV